jgi:mono/diheme cytochrome c family protein
MVLLLLCSAVLVGCQVEPTPKDPAVLGQMVYANNCAACHGVSGAGASMMLQGTGIAFNDKQWQQKYTDVQIANIIKNGQNSMPNFNFTPEESAALVQYLRTLPQASAD